MQRNLTQADKDEIVRLAEAGVSTGAIARRLGRGHDTILMARLRCGIPETRHKPVQRAAHTRCGVPVRPFSAAEDQHLMESADCSMTQLSKDWTKTFGYQRARSTLTQRMKKLVAYMASIEDEDA